MFSEEVLSDPVFFDFVLDNDLPLKDQEIIPEVMVGRAGRTFDKKFDWTENLPSGSQVSSIVVVRGEILEKSYLNNKDELIVVRRD